MTSRATRNSSPASVTPRPRYVFAPDVAEVYPRPPVTTVTVAA